MSKWRMLIVTALLCVGVSGMSYAEEADTAADFRAKLSSRLQEKEAALTSGIEQEMKAMDENNDGYISEEEFMNYRIDDFREKQRKIFTAVDGNQDKKISKEEMTDFTHRTFKAFLGMLSN